MNVYKNAFFVFLVCFPHKNQLFSALSPSSAMCLAPQRAQLFVK